MTPPEAQARKTTRPRMAVALTGLLAGLLLLAVGAGIGLPHLEKSGLTFDSLLGLAALVLGLLAVVLTGRRLVRPVRSWRRIPVVLALLTVAVLLVYVVAIPLRAALPPRAAPPQSPPGGPAAAEVVVPTEDDLGLSGWYLPSRSGAAVVLLPGSGSSSAALHGHADALAESGFGVLALDPRGQGRSEGRAMDWGWFGDVDVPAAVSWLTAQDDVDPGRVAVVGLSMGGEQAVGAAGVDPRIRAVVAEGVTGRTAADLGWLPEAYGWRGSFTQGVRALQTAIAEPLTSAERPPALREAVAASAPRPILLITAEERPDELLAAEHLRQAAPASVEIWTVPGARHTAGLATDPEEWSRRVVGFLSMATS